MKVGNPETAEGGAVTRIINFDQSGDHLIICYGSAMWNVGVKLVSGEPVLSILSNRGVLVKEVVWTSTKGE